MSQKTDTMIKLALVFFVSLLSFSIGTYVGKKYSDNQHKLAELEPNKTVTTHAEEFATASEPTENVEPTQEIKKATTLSDSEVAKIAEEFATEDAETSEEKPIASTTDEKEIKSISIETASKTKPVAVKKPASPAAIKEEAEERIPASIPPQTGHFTVQVASFPTQAEAQKMTKDLQSKGYKTSFVAATVNGQTWYRVNVGLFGSLKEAQDYRVDFLEQTKLSSAIVQKLQK